GSGQSDDRYHPQAGPQGADERCGALHGVRLAAVRLQRRPRLLHPHRGRAVEGPRAAAPV
ncbi:MAG: hypothetical protein AVDCRST_MAG16-715, partial [uncultured Frankineae bacterium]